MTTETPSNDLGAIGVRSPSAGRTRPTGNLPEVTARRLRYGLHGDRIRIAWAADHGELLSPVSGPMSLMLVLCRSLPLSTISASWWRSASTRGAHRCSTWPRDGLPGAAPQRMWLWRGNALAPRWLWAAAHGHRAGGWLVMGNQPDRNAALRALEEVINKAETNA